MHTASGFCDYSEVVRAGQLYAWPETRGGELASLACRASEGYMTRFCRTGGQGWLPINVSQCSSVLDLVSEIINGRVSPAINNSWQIRFIHCQGYGGKL